MTADLIAWFQIIISVILIFIVLAQKNTGGIGTMFGGASSITGGEFYRGRKTADKFLFYFTIVNGAFLVLSSFLYFYI